MLPKIPEDTLTRSGNSCWCFSVSSLRDIGCETISKSSSWSPSLVGEVGAAAGCSFLGVSYMDCTCDRFGGSDGGFGGTGGDSPPAAAAAAAAAAVE